MLLTIYCRDNPGSAPLRAKFIEMHKQYVAGIADRIAFAGPLRDAPGSEAVGSLIVADFTDVEAARTWLAGEPFTRGGVYASTEILHFTNLWPQRTGYAPEAAQAVAR